MARLALLAVLVSPVAAGLANECMKGLQQLEGEHEVELAVRCRAAFSPEVCKQARQSLGAQPWTQARMQGSCARFAAAYQGMDARTLEAAIATKPSTKLMDASTQGKTPVTAPSPPQAEPQGPFAGLRKKLQEGKAAKEAEAAKEEPSGPLAGLINKIKEGKKANDADDADEGPLAGLIKKIKEGKAKDEAESKIKEGKKANDADDADEGPLAGLIKKIKEGKAKDEAESSPEDGPLSHLFKKNRDAQAVKLYDDVQLPASKPVPQFLGALGGAVTLAAVTLLVASSRRTAFGAQSQWAPQPDVEQSAE